MPDDDRDAGLARIHPSNHLRAADDPPPSRPDLPLVARYADAARSFEVVTYGPDIPDESTLRLLGNVEGKRILQLGCAAGQCAVALASQGAKVIAVDPSNDRLDQVRTASDRAEVRVELHHGDLAELAFIRADTIDGVLSVYTLATVADLDRVFRQVHRVLRPESHLVFSVPHPAMAVATRRSYFDREPESWTAGPGLAGTWYPRTIGEIFGGLGRANFRLDTLLEPEADQLPRSELWRPEMEVAPATLVLRARKEGI